MVMKNNQNIDAAFSKKTFLITGGTGSIGSALIRHLLKREVKEIRILSRDEYKQSLMERTYGDKRLKFYLADIREHEAIKDAFKGVDYVFHAAALKQVPKCENFPLEAIKTNVIGANNVISACLYHKVKKAVFLSTDKAVYPTSAMGMSKALMEKVVLSKAKEIGEGDTILSLIRYGNVLGSRGSIIPLLLDDIKSGRSLMITNPDMTRFILSEEEAVELALYAFKNAMQGELFIKKAPAITIQTLVEALIRVTKAKVKINYIGAREGEKFSEILLTHEEMSKAIDEGSFLRVLPSSVNAKNKVLDISSYSSSSARLLSVDEAISLLRKSAIFNGRNQLE